MPVFRCEAVGSEGDGRTNVVEAANADEAGRLFHARGLFVTKITEVKGTERVTPHGDSTSVPGRHARGMGGAALPSDEPPPGSGIRCHLDGEQLVLYLPPSSAVYQGPFPFIAISFVVFLALVTLFAILGGLQPGDAVFIVPILCGLWLVGLGLLYIYVRGRFGKTYILVEPGRLIRRFDLLGWQRTREYYLDRESCASLVADFGLQYGGTAGRSSWGWLSGSGKPVHHVHVTTADRPAKFGSYLSDEEKKWLAGRINRHLGRGE